MGKIICLAGLIMFLKPVQAQDSLPSLWVGANITGLTSFTVGGNILFSSNHFMLSIRYDHYLHKTIGYEITGYSTTAAHENLKVHGDFHEQAVRIGLQRVFNEGDMLKMFGGVDLLVYLDQAEISYVHSTYDSLANLRVFSDQRKTTNINFGVAPKLTVSIKITGRCLLSVEEALILRSQYLISIIPGRERNQQGSSYSESFHPRIFVVDSRPFVQLQHTLLLAWKIR